VNLKFKHAIPLFLLGMLLLHAIAFWSARGLIRQGYPDFTSFYAAGKIVHDGQGIELYDPAAQWRAQQQFAAEVGIRRGPLPYFHPPFEALLFAPLSHHRYLTAYLIWDALNVLVVLFVVWLLRSNLPALKRLPVWWLTLLPFAFTPVFLALLQGQDSLLLLMSYTLAYLALKKHADFRAGCWLGLGLFKPQLVVPFVIVLLLQRKMKVVFGFFAIAVVLAAISAGIVGWSGFLHYPSQIWSLEQSAGLVSPQGVPNLRGIVEAALSNWLPEHSILVLIAILSAVVIFGAAAQKSQTTGSESWDLVFCVGMLATCLVSYHLFAQDLSILLLPVLLVLSHVLDGQTQDSFAVIAPALLLFGLVFPLLQVHFLDLLAVVLLVWVLAMLRSLSRSAKAVST
jgi:hypothetical protein